MYVCMYVYIYIYIYMYVYIYIYKKQLLVQMILAKKSPKYYKLISTQHSNSKFRNPIVSTRQGR